jgi:DNA polymerase-3 subunit epsilon
VHGITDEDVRDCPTFKEVATEVAAYLSGCDLGGFNVLSYDIPLLEEEFKRAGVMFSSEDRAVVDAQRIFHRKEPRDLSSALKFYSGETHEDAHGALPDVEATISVLEGQYAKYDDLPETVPELSEFCSPPNPRFVDRRGKIVWDGDGEAAINFGKNTGRKLRDMAHTDPSFLQWILDRDFPRDTQEIVRNAMAGQFPRKPDPDSDE